MELNFNSVEMSSKPNAEASVLDYAEAPLTFNSVETIPNLNASAAFKVDSPTLQVPHPHLPERDFFLRPMMELAPDWQHPASGLTASEMLNKLA